MRSKKKLIEELSDKVLELQRENEKITKENESLNNCLNEIKIDIGDNYTTKGCKPGPQCEICIFSKLYNISKGIYFEPIRICLKNNSCKHFERHP